MGLWIHGSWIWTHTQMDQNWVWFKSQSWMVGMDSYIFIHIRTKNRPKPMVIFLQVLDIDPYHCLNNHDPIYSEWEASNFCRHGCHAKLMITIQVILGGFNHIHCSSQQIVWHALEKFIHWFMHTYCTYIHGALKKHLPTPKVCFLEKNPCLCLIVFCSY